MPVVDDLLCAHEAATETLHSICKHRQSLPDKASGRDRKRLEKEFQAEDAALLTEWADAFSSALAPNSEALHREVRGGKMDGAMAWGAEHTPAVFFGRVLRD